MKKTPKRSVAKKRKEARTARVKILAKSARAKKVAQQQPRRVQAGRSFKRERDEALARERATSEVLGIIASSPADATPVFQAIVANAARLCDAEFSAVARYDGQLLHLAAVSNMSSKQTTAYHSLFPRRPVRNFVMGRAFLDGEPVHVEDVEAEAGYDPHTLQVLKSAAPYRTFLGVPLLRNGVPIGAIGCGRRIVKPFTVAQISLVQTFAAQAVIAIENARLLSELRESLE